MNRTLIAIALINMSGCGIFQPKYVKYAPSTPTGSSGSGTDAACKSAQTAFDQYIEPVITSTCINCHKSTALAGSTLISGNSTQHRTQLKSFSGGVAETLFSKISNASKHGGGDQSATLPQATITKWTDVEATCK